MHEQPNINFILLVEDDEGIAELVQEALVDQALQVVCVSEGKAAFQWLEKYRPRLILLDYSLPDMSGLEFVEQLAAAAETPLPFIVTTGAGDERVAVAMMKRGARDYLIKDRYFLEVLPRVVERVLREITTEQKLAEAERALQERQKLYSQMFTNHSAVMLLIDPQTGSIVEANPAAAQFYGWPTDVLTQMSIQEINTASLEDVATLRRKAETREQNEFIFQHRLASGEIRDVEARSVPTQIGGRTLLYSILHDITDRKHAEEALRESEERYRMILKTAMDGFWLVDLQGRLLEVNESYRQMVGYTEQELLSMCIPDLETIEQPADTAAHMQYIMEKGEDRFETRHRRKDGSHFEVEIGVQYRPGESGLMFAFLRDITERKQAEERIFKERQNFLTMFAAAPVGLLLLDGETTITQANQSAADLVLRDPVELIGQRAGGGLGCVHSLENPRGCGFGRACPICPLRRGLESVLAGGPSIRGAEIETTLLIGGATQSRWLSVSAEPVEIAGEQHVIVSIDDITERKHTEDSVRLALHEKEALLRELYHRTKNNMQVISAMLNLESDRSHDKTLQQTLLDMDGRIRSMALVHQKLYQSQNLSSIDLQEYLSELANLMFESYQIEPGRVTLSLETESIPVLIDNAIPCGLIVNEILSNALKYAFPGERKGEIKIRLARLAEHRILIEISDNGVGVPLGEDLRQKNTLGVQMILGIAGHQLDAQVDLDTTKGISWRILFSDNNYHSRV
ncbi:MAG TPA: hypothetical protein DEH22_16970 [Chloroflexi bacterium]|nr:hypothetical protein [Chloroflexota bacterium]